MDSLISGIIDCVARPSTADSPVRVLRKANSESPNCVSSGGSTGMLVYPAESMHSAGGDSDSSDTTTSHHSHFSTSMNIPPPPSSSHGHMRGISSSSLSLSRLMVPGGEMQISMAGTPINSVLTAEGIIMGDERGFTCGTCGDHCSPCYNDHNDDGGCTTSSGEPIAIDNVVVRQFEAAFATFLYKNPAFTSMSHTTLQKLRTKLLKESAKNIRVEAELRRQLADLREAKRNRELELQRELLVVTRAKAAREAELLIQIQKTRRSSMMLDQKSAAVTKASTATSSSPAPAPSAAPSSPTTSAMSWFGFNYSSASATESPIAPANTTTPPATPPAIRGSDSFESFAREIRNNKMEQAHILAEMEKIKMQIAEANCTP